MRQRVGILGFRGYSGAELVRLLQRHPRVQPFLLEHRPDPADRPVPLNAHEPKRLPCQPDVLRTEGLTLVFLATPAEVSMEVAPALLNADIRVVDLSGAFRFRDE